MSGKLVRAVAPSGAPIRIFVDGAALTAYAGESVLVAVLSECDALRQHEFSDEARAGFCLMGACQDCWVWLADQSRVRACTTTVADGMHILTRVPQGLYQP
jgi:hypothetical protein